MPQMFQMMHLRSWAGEAATAKPAWASFIWLSQQYFSGLIAFAFFLLTQCKSEFLQMCCRYTWLTLVFSSRSSIEMVHDACLHLGSNDEPQLCAFPAARVHTLDTSVEEPQMVRRLRATYSCRVCIASPPRRHGNDDACNQQSPVPETAISHDCPSVGSSTPPMDLAQS